MSRARVTALALVNWKGVFYERYLLDRHVTALEGANGAGKTTVMIAAYVVLLPDMSRLRFTNLGESGATSGDRGIFGRLGEAGRPSYSALDLEVGGSERLLAGVRLTRGAEPTVDATPFLVTGLAPEVRLQDLLLVRRDDADYVPELDEVKDAVKRAGGAIEVFRSTKAYLAALFERGVTPLRLASDEDRNKLNEMLRTSMTGGISRSLTTELRSFLLKEESGLADTLTRMRANLDACRRTRGEVAEARHLEREISDIYEAGLAMFTAAIHAAREAADEGEARLVATTAERAAAERTAAELAERAAALADRQATLDERIAGARAEVEHAVVARDRQASARALAARVAELEGEVTERTEGAARAKAQQAAAAEERAARRRARELAAEAYDRAGQGLANLQDGLDELHRRAHAHRHLRRRLDEARALLERPDLVPGDATAVAVEVAARRESLEAERARLERDARDLAVRRQEHARALAALIDLETATVTAVHADEAAGVTTNHDDAAALDVRAGEEPATAAASDGGSTSAAAGSDVSAGEAPATATAAASQSGSSPASATTSLDATSSAPALPSGDASAGSEGFGEASANASSPATPHARARAALARLAEREALVARSGELARELAEAERVATRQQAVRARAKILALPVGVAGAAGEVAARVEATERALAEADEAARAADAAASAERDRLAAATAERRALEQRAATWGFASEIAQRLAGALDLPVASRADVLAVRDRLGDEQRDLAARRAALTAEREAQLRRAAALETAGGEVDPELLRLRDELGGELLQERFEDLEPEEAAWAEARLGPLVGALIVEDARAAAEILAEGQRTLPTVWLVEAGSDLELEQGAEGANDAICAERFGVRVTRRATAPTLGRRARERRAADLRTHADALAAELDALADRHQRLSAWRRDVELLAADAEVLEQGAPDDALAACAAAIATATEEEQRQAGVAAEARERASAARTSLADLRRLLGEALLLEPPDHEARRAELARAHAAARAGREELAAVAEARRTLAELVETLRAPPPAEADVAAGAVRCAALAAELDRLYRAAAAVEDVVAHAHAAGWDDAEAALATQAAVVPQLQAQHAAARDAVAAADRAIEAADAAWEAATAVAQEAEAQRSAAAAHLERAQQELAELAVDGPPAEAADAERAVTGATERLAALEAEARSLVEEVTLARERGAQASRRAEAARSEAAEQARAAAPAADAWQALREAAREAGLLDAVLSSPSGRAQRGRGSVQLTAEAASKRDVLLDRLGRARGGETLAHELRERDEAPLAVWLAAREWLRRRVPAQVAEVADPLDALERLRDHLDVLEGRLARQEGDLRGASEDVARGIEVQLRRAKNQVRTLNQHLHGVSFGSIAGIRVQMNRIDRMEQILRALREGEAQELLFLPSMPIEEALDEIFRRHGGGRGGGQRLLDYREYLTLAVEIKRASADEWELTSPTRLSTGEAIGVGAALMMVVLTAWERDSNLLRGRRTGGSLRFLFLDEANRLSGDNLGVLFDLCRNLDLQLLIAAPEVARAEGNTTYRLIRQVTPDGREEVIVSGRRALPKPANDDASDGLGAVDAGDGALADERAAAAAEADAADDGVAADDADTADDVVAADDALAVDDAPAVNDALAVNDTLAAEAAVAAEEMSGSDRMDGVAAPAPAASDADAVQGQLFAPATSPHPSSAAAPKVPPPRGEG